MRGISLLVFAVTLAGGAHAAELKEMGCGRTLEKNGVPHLIMDEKLHVLDAGRFEAGAVPAGYQLKSIFCARSDIVPAPSDWRVVEAGYPLMLFARDAETKRTRIAVLETADGRLRLRSVGEVGFSRDLTQRIQTVLDSSAPQIRPGAR